MPSSTFLSAIKPVKVAELDIIYVAGVTLLLVSLVLVMTVLYDMLDVDKKAVQTKALRSDSNIWILYR